MDSLLELNDEDFKEIINDDLVKQIEKEQIFH
jgi:hypothetical protein